MKILLKNATIINEKSSFHNQKLDLLLENGVLARIDSKIETEVDKVIELKDLHVSTGWFDPNVSFGEPGFEERETLENGLLTASKSGFTHVLLNPNTDPVLSSHSDVSFLIRNTGAYTTKLHVSSALSKNSEGKQMAPLYDMHKAGSCAFGDFNLPISNPNLLRVALDYIQGFDGIIQAHSFQQRIPVHISPWAKVAQV